MSKVDYVVLDTEATENVTDLKMQVLNATGYAGVPATKLLLAAAAGAPLMPLSRKWPSGLYRSGRWPDWEPTTFIMTIMIWT